MKAYGMKTRHGLGFCKVKRCPFCTTKWVSKAKARREGKNAARSF
jgi:hypothetical protein